MHKYLTNLFNLTNYNCTSKSANCSSVRTFFATTSVRNPSRAIFPHFKYQNITII